MKIISISLAFLFCSFGCKAQQTEPSQETVSLFNKAHSCKGKLLSNNKKTFSSIELCSLDRGLQVLRIQKSLVPIAKHITFIIKEKKLVAVKQQSISLFHGITKKVKIYHEFSKKGRWLSFTRTETINRTISSNGKMRKNEVSAWKKMKKKTPNPKVLWKKYHSFLPS